VSPRQVTDSVVRELPLLSVDATVKEAVERLLETGEVALPVLDQQGRYAGVFGEREFLAALFPGYLKEVSYAGFVPRALEDVFEKRGQCAEETVGQHMLTEHVDVDPDYSDMQVAETFLHHRVLIVPVVERGRVVGVVTRSEFFRRLGARFVGQA